VIRNYSDSKPIKWIRKKVFKIEKPMSLGWGEWTKWEEKIKKEKPIAFFFTETLPDLLEWFPEHSVDYIDKIRCYIINIIDGSHLLRSNLAKGKYHEFSERVLYSLFDSYIDFIETEEAHMQFIADKKEASKKYKMPWWNNYRILRWFGRWRCAEAGIDYLKWEMTLDQPDPTDPYWVASPYQAQSAREKMTLYTWWKHIRPRRGDSWEVSGLQSFWYKMDEKYGGNWLGLGAHSKMSATEERTYRKLQKKKNDLEESWNNEDEEMMIRLIKIRRDLWT
jgi:hypothetical protein